MTESRAPVARLFDSLSRLYDTEILQRLIYRPNQDMVLSELRKIAPSRVLDVGCGTGIFATRIIEEQYARQVVGCDLSEGMLEQARNRSKEVSWIQGDATKLPLRGSSVDAVTCTEAFHFFDQPAALAEFQRVLKPDGRMLVAVVNPYTKIGSRLLGAQASRAIGTGNWPTRDQMHRMVSEAGFEVVSQRRVGRIASRAIPTVLTVASRLPAPR